MKGKPKAPKRSKDSNPKPSLKVSTETARENPLTWIRIKDSIQLPEPIRLAIKTLSDAGYVAYVVGGAVRDALLKRPVKDFDVVTSALPDEICKLFPKSLTVGKAFGVIKVPAGSGEKYFEVATFRSDLEYKNHRHPQGVRFSGPEEDARRRDFTINALYFDPKTSRILDLVGGMADLKAKVVRAIGDPLQRFEEDALRLLRAVRFTVDLEFKLDPDTSYAVKRRSRLVDKVSGERIREEIEKMLLRRHPDRALQMLDQHQLLAPIFPELMALKGLRQAPIYKNTTDVWHHTLECLKFMAEQNENVSAPLAWATLFHCIGKPLAFRRSNHQNFNNHEQDGARLAGKICARLKFSKADTDRVLALISEYLRFEEVFRMREATLQRWLRQPHFLELLALHRIDATTSEGNMAYYEFCLGRLREMEKEPARESWIDGDDLIQLGLEPGPRFSQILKEIENLTLERKLSSKEEALEFVMKHYI